MAPALRHPKYEAAAAQQLRHLANTVACERERAIAGLESVIEKLEALRRCCDAPILRTLATEYAVYLRALAGLNAANIDGGLQDQLEFIRTRLHSGLRVIQEVNAPAEPAADDAQGDRP
jgi:hypothetical protein